MPNPAHAKRPVRARCAHPSPGLSVHPVGMTYKPAKLLTAGAMARRLRVRAAWLRSEAEAGRIPHVRAEDEFLFDPDAVERVLLERAQRDPKGTGRG